MRDHALVQLTLARMREFYREPEAIFWVFGLRNPPPAKLGSSRTLSVTVRSPPLAFGL